MDISQGPLFCHYNSQNRQRMFQHDVVYKDHNGKQHTETLYFHLTSPEMLDLQFNPMVDDDLDKFISEGIRSGEGRKLWIIFKLLIANSYGRRTEDGARFLKKTEWTEEFINGSPQFEKFFEWLLLDSPDGKHGKEFYNAIMPERLRGDLAKLEGEAGSAKPSLKNIPREDLERMFLEKMAEGKTAETKVIEA